MAFEYKTVGAPERGKRGRGLRSATARVAAAFDEILQSETADGWEYLRTDLLPVTERSGWFGRAHDMHRAVMVFRRPLRRAPDLEDAMVLRRAPAVTPPPAPAAAQEPLGVKPEPEVGIDPDLRLAETVRGPGGSKPDH